MADFVLRWLTCLAIGICVYTLGEMSVVWLHFPHL